MFCSILLYILNLFYFFLANGTFIDDTQIKPNQIVILRKDNILRFGLCEDTMKVVENENFIQI